MAAESLPGFGPTPPKAEKPHKDHHPHRGRHITVAALSVALAAGGSTGVAWWLRGNNQESGAGGGAGSSTGGHAGGTGENGGQPVTGHGAKPSSKPPTKPTHKASPTHAAEKGSDTKGLSLECSLGATAITKDGTQLHIKPTLKVRGGHPDASRFFTVADVITGTTDANRHKTATISAEGKGAAVTAPVPKDMQFPRDDVPVQVFYFPIGQQIPSTEHMSVTATDPGGIVAACGNASVTYALAHGGITLPGGSSFTGSGG